MVGTMSKIPDFLEKFSETAARRRDWAAVEAADGTFTYSELDRLSNQLANRLRGLGVDRDSPVAISLPRGAGELLALLATAKAGGAYVPLDPSHPADWLLGIVEDAAPHVMVVHPQSPLREVGGAGARVLVFEDIAGATEGHAATPPDVRSDPEQLAYILFTSGSTGRPKGVEVTRGAFGNFLRSMAHTPGMSEDARLLAITTTSFDIAGLELFLPLWVGATTVIADRETVQDSRRLRRRLESDNISIMQATPAAWRLLLEAGWRGDGTLRMLCGGEALSPALADRLLASGRELWNMYGPTETTVWSTLERIAPGYDRITIGRPIDETQVHVLDEDLNPVPAGREGEISIGGQGLARGYRGRPDLTAQRFVQNPRGCVGDRIYRTGDLGRALPDGRFECLGRLDHQVKIRGFRVELGQIETVLRSVPGVAEALVVADVRDDGDPRLLAYHVGEADRDALIAEAQRRLPAYMVPAAYVALTAFPLNTNGKIDRKRLPRPEVLHRDGSPYHRPRTDTETRIAAVWRDVLGLERVSVDESFFTIGGTSMLAMQVVARIEEEMGVDVSLQAFFDTPTVEGVAASIGKSFSAGDPIVVWLRRGAPEQPPLFCVFGVNLYQDLALALGGDRSVVGVHVPFRYAPGQERPPALGHLAQLYLDLIRRYQPTGPYSLLGLCFGGVVAYEVARKLEAMGETVAMVAILDAVLPNAFRMDVGKRLRSYAQRALRRGPRELVPWLTRAVRRRILSRWPGLGGLRWLRADAGPANLIDFPVDGPDADSAVARFALEGSRLSSRLLVVRATQEPTPTWMTIDPDHGWGQRAEEVIVCDIPANHMDILREPHVGALARAVAEVAESTSARSGPRRGVARLAVACHDVEGVSLEDRSSHEQDRSS